MVVEKGGRGGCLLLTGSEVFSVARVVGHGMIITDVEMTCVRVQGSAAPHARHG